MTIQEVEKQTGMTRGNIRFYESKGLIDPNRKSNGYRDYSKEDIEILKKIRLLRSLHISIEDIINLQKNSISLLSLLTKTQNKLQNEKNDITYALEIIDAMKEDRASYTNLNAQKYLLGIEKTKATTKTDYFSIENDRTSYAFKPWRRFFARALDFTIYSVFWSFILTSVFRVKILQRPSMGRFLDTYIVLIITLIMEPIFIWLFGQTLGKAVFGLKISNLDNRRLSYRQSLDRTKKVISSGLGFGIPIYNLYRLYKSYQKCTDEEILPWDIDTAYTIKDTKSFRYVIFIFAHIILFVITAFIPLFGQMPVNRGDISTSEFVENYNDLASYHNIDNGGRILKKDGTWEDLSGKNGTYIIRVSDVPLPNFNIIEENGEIIKISFETELRDNESWISNFSSYIELATMSFVYAQKEIGLISNAKEFKKVFDQNSFDDFSFEKANIKVSCDYDYLGYNNTNGGILIPKENASTYFSIKFEMSKIKY